MLSSSDKAKLVKKEDKKRKTTKERQVKKRTKGEKKEIKIIDFKFNNKTNKLEKFSRKTTSEIYKNLHELLTKIKIAISTKNPDELFGILDCDVTISHDSTAPIQSIKDYFRAKTHSAEQGLDLLVDPELVFEARTCLLRNYIYFIDSFIEVKNAIELSSFLLTQLNHLRDLLGITLEMSTSQFIPNQIDLISLLETTLKDKSLSDAKLSEVGQLFKPLPTADNNNIKEEKTEEENAYFESLRSKFLTNTV